MMASVLSEKIKLQALALILQYKRERPTSKVGELAGCVIISRPAVDKYCLEKFNIRLIALWDCIEGFEPDMYGTYEGFPCIIGKDRSLLILSSNQLVRLNKYDLSEIKHTTAAKNKRYTLLNTILGVDHD